VVPVLVIVEPAKMPKLPAVPSEGACAWLEDVVIAVKLAAANTKTL